MNREKYAVLGVDIQNDFCPGGSLAVAEGDKVITPMNQVLQAILRVGGQSFLSRDWHPEGSTHFQNWPVHCVANTDGAKFHPRLDTQGSTIISKGMGMTDDAYSAFDGETEDSQKLAKLLTACKVLIVGGLATDYCVKASVIDASKIPNLQVLVLLDAVKAVNLRPGDAVNALYAMEDAGARFTTSKKIIGLLK